MNLKATDINESSMKDCLNERKSSDPSRRKHQIIYRSIITFTYLHVAALYGLYLCCTSAKWATIGFTCFLYACAQLGITAGAHRLWSHRSYKAKLPLQIILIVFNSLAFQNSALNWIRDHRLHHKCCDTDGDPHNAKRGFFYSHVGWLLTKKSDEVRKQGSTIDMSDAYSNPVLTFQKKYAVPFIGSICFALPTLIPMYFWGETLNNAWHANMLRYVLNLNITFCVNSAAHMWGYKPYDKNLLPSQNMFVTFTCLGEGFHNYHHVFPWDYRASELGNTKYNLTTSFIDLFAKIGWAYDLKTAPKDLVKRRAEKTGDGTDLWGNKLQ